MPETPEKQSLPERAKELTDKLEAGMKELYQSDKYTNYLKTMAQFHHYSPRNIMLIQQQLPNATRVASFKLWEEMNRHVKKGEHSVKIYAPIADKKPEIKLMEKLDPETGAPLLDEQGKPIMEEMTALVGGPRFKLVSVFDVSQTYGEPLPQLAENLTGDVAHYGAFLDALKAVSPLPVVMEPMAEEQDGYCRYGEQIGIREGMSESQTVAAVIHEITHAKLHDPAVAAADTPAADKTKRVKEIEAESVAYVVSQHFGVETSPNSFGYLAEYGSRDMSELKASLDTIRKEANRLINSIDDRFTVICKSRGIDLTFSAPEQARPEQPAPQTARGAEPLYTTETHTENMVGVNFEYQDVIRQNTEPAAAKQTARIESDENMPDYSIGQSEMNLYGYNGVDMLPMLKERALELFDKDLPVFMLNPDNTEAMAFDRSDIEEFDGIFGVTRDEWQRSPEYFLKPDSFEIYQVRDGDELRDVRFTSLDDLKAADRAVDRANYDLVYTAPLAAADTLDTIYERFNADRPLDFTGRSLSMSDVVVLRRDGEQSAHYVDSVGFADVPGFLIEKQPEKAAETVSHPAADKPATGENVAAVEARVKSGDSIKLTDLMGAIRADQQKAGGEAPKPTPPPVPKREKPTPEPVKPADVPVYKQSLDYARGYGELEQYQQSNTLNRECAKAIDTAIKVNNYEQFRYNMPSALKMATKDFGAERVNWVLASVIQNQSHDGRYSRANKEWANTFPIPEKSGVYLNSHPILVDGFADRARQAAAEKPSVLAALKTGAEKSRQQPQPEPKKESQKSKRQEI